MRITIKFTGITEKNHRPRRASHPRRISGLDLTALLFAVSTSPRYVILINQSGIFWLAPMTSSVTWALSTPPNSKVGGGQLCDKLPFPSHSKVSGPQIIFSFLFTNSSLAPSFSHRKHPFSSTPWSAF